MRVAFAAILGLALHARSSDGQYLYLDTNFTGTHDAGDRLQPGTTTVDVYLDTNRDRDGVFKSCPEGGSIQINSYEVILKAEGGTVEFGPREEHFLSGDYTGFFARSPLELTSTIYFHDGSGTYVPGPPGHYWLCRIPVTILSGCPELKVETSLPFNGAAFTSFGTSCVADDEYSHTYILGRNWVDVDGAGPPLPSPTAPTIVGPSSISGAEGEAISVTATASDPDPGAFLTVSVTGAPPSLTLSGTTGPSPVTATLSGTLGFDDAGTYYIVWTVSDGACGTSATLVTTLEVLHTERAPVVSAPQSVDAEAGMMVTVNVTALDPDKDPLSSLSANLDAIPQGEGPVFRLTNANWSSGVLTWTPTSNTVGNTYPVSFHAANSLSGSAQTVIHVIGANYPTGVESAAPPGYQLDANHPNPFNPATRIRYSIGKRERVRIAVYDPSGRRVATLVDADQDGGEHETQWLGLNEQGDPVVSGVYFYRIDSGSYAASRRMVLLR